MPTENPVKLSKATHPEGRTALRNRVSYSWGSGYGYGFLKLVVIQDGHEAQHFQGYRVLHHEERLSVDLSFSLRKTQEGHENNYTNVRRKPPMRSSVGGDNL